MNFFRKPQKLVLTPKIGVDPLIQRRAYGYRNFQNYRLRVLIECGHIVI